MNKFLEYITECAEAAVINHCLLPEAFDELLFEAIIKIEKCFEGTCGESQLLYQRFDHEEELFSVNTNLSPYFWSDKLKTSVKIRAYESRRDSGTYWTILEVLPVTGLETVADHFSSEELLKIQKYLSKLAPKNRATMQERISSYVAAGNELHFSDRNVESEKDKYAAICNKLNLIRSTLPEAVLDMVEELFASYEFGSNSEQRNSLKILKDITDLFDFGHYKAVPLEQVSTALDDSHYGLHSLKRELLDALSRTNEDLEHIPPVIVLVGRVGNGKRSLVQSFAKAIGQKCDVFPLDGLSDSITINGSSRNYDNSQSSRLFEMVKSLRSYGVIIFDRPEDAVSEECISGIKSFCDKGILNDTFIAAPIPTKHLWKFILVNDPDRVPSWCSNYKVIILPEYSTCELEQIINTKLIPNIAKRFCISPFLLSKPAIKMLINLSLLRNISGINERLETIIGTMKVTKSAPSSLTPGQILNIFFPKGERKYLETHYAKDEFSLRQKYIYCNCRDRYEENVQEKCTQLFEKLQKIENKEYPKDALRALVNVYKKPRKAKEKNLSLSLVRERLDKSHIGMEKAKFALLLSLRKAQLSHTRPTPILLVGPPGCGKTTITKAFAHALDREQVKISLNSVSCSEELTGSKDKLGLIWSAICKEEVCSSGAGPVIRLDELDKLCHSGQNCLLNVLDGADGMYEGFLDLHLDISDVLFIATANSLDTIIKPLRDRFRIVELENYNEEETYAITKHIISKLKNEFHLNRLEFGEEAVNELSRLSGISGIRDIERSVEQILLTKSECEGNTVITKEDVLSLGFITKRKCGY